MLFGPAVGAGSSGTCPVGRRNDPRAAGNTHPELCNDGHCCQCGTGSVVSRTEGLRAVVEGPFSVSPVAWSRWGEVDSWDCERPGRKSALGSLFGRRSFQRRCTGGGRTLNEMRCGKTNVAATSPTSRAAPSLGCPCFRPADTGGRYNALRDRGSVRLDPIHLVVRLPGFSGSTRAVRRGEI